MRNNDKPLKVSKGIYWYRGIHIIFSGEFWEMFEGGRKVGECYKLWGAVDMIEIGAYHLPANG